MEDIEIVTCEVLPDKTALNGILRDYYELIVSRMNTMGFEVDRAAPESALAEFWENAGTTCRLMGASSLQSSHPERSSAVACSKSWMPKRANSSGSM